LLSLSFFIPLISISFFSRIKPAKLAVIAPRIPIPVVIIKTASILPWIVLGKRSPYPTVVIVTIDHHKLFPIVSDSKNEYPKVPEISIIIKIRIPLHAFNELTLLKNFIIICHIMRK
jgi:hypothetical protein